MTEEHIRLLYAIADRIKTGRELMGSKWGNCEAEHIALQILAGSRAVHRKHGEAFSWQGLGTQKSGSGISNPEGVGRLLRDGSIVLEEYDGDLKPENDVVISENGKPMVFRPTPSLLYYAASQMGVE